MLDKILKNKNSSSPSHLNNKLHQKNDFGSPLTIDSSKTAKLFMNRPKSGKHHYLLIKNYSERYTYERLQEKYSKYEGYEKIIVIPGSQNVYIKFEEMMQVHRIIEENDNAIISNGQNLKMCIVNKLPLDLNEKSRILLVTVYNEKIDINVNSIYDIFKDFAKIRKIIIFKKKNYQVFIEFETSDDASFFKEAFHNINYKGLFFLKIQFTQKNNLIVNTNNHYERDFTKEVKRKSSPHSIDFTLDTSCDKQHVKQISNLNYLGSLACLDEKNTSCLISSPKISPSESKRLFIVKATNLDIEVRHKVIFNLFSLYGTIEKITLDPFNQSALIYFVSEFDQITAYHYLNCVDLFGKIIFLHILKEPNTNDKLNSLTTSNDDSNTVYYAKNKHVKPEDIQNRQKTINKPSNILYVFNLSKSVNLDVIKSVFETLKKVEKIYYVNESRNSALCFFDTIESAVHILCVFKNMNVIDKSLKINFANESLVKDTNDQKYKTNYFSLPEFEEKTKFSGLFRINDSALIKAEKAYNEKSKFAFNEFKLF